MGYWLGLDVGTTFSAAGVCRGGRVEIVGLGNQAAVVPSLLFLREDGSFVVGEAAARRGVGEPGRLARGFKRRFGDPTPVLLGGSPFSADGLTSVLVRWLVAVVAEREGGAAEAVAVTCPANWGRYKADLLGQALRSAGLGEVVVLSEPEAAAVFYASSERVEVGAVVAVYDLGGGTFDAAVLRKSAVGFELLGVPEGIERLGGIDFDEAVVGHVLGFLGAAVSGLDVSDPVVVAALARLRADCVAAKEALSADTEVSIPVLLPSVQTEIRLTRSEFESMIRPPLAETTAVLGRALVAAGVSAGELAAVLLVGGSSRIPLVGQLVAAELGRPVAIDVHPKHAVAEGAALAAGRLLGMAEVTPVARRQPKAEAPVVPETAAPGGADSEVAAPEGADSEGAGLDGAGLEGAGPSGGGASVVGASVVGASVVDAPPALGAVGDGRGGRRRSTLVIGGLLVATIAIVALAAALLGRGSTSGRPKAAAAGAGTSSASTRPATTIPASTTTTINVPPGATLAFSDNFSDSTSGWAADANQEGAGTAEYRSDGYYVSGLKPLPLLNTFSATSPYAQKLTSILVAADATIVSGVAADGAGVRCDQGSRAGLRYTFEVFGDATWVIFKIGDTGSVSLQAGSNPAIHTGGATNTVSGQCSEVNGGATKLTMAVNGVVLGTVTDPHPAGAIAWHAALTVYRSASSPATVVRFNKFRTFAASPA